MGNDSKFNTLLERQTWRLLEYGISSVQAKDMVIKWVLSITQSELMKLVNSKEITLEQANIITEYQYYIRKKFIMNIIDDMGDLFEEGV